MQRPRREGAAGVTNATPLAPIAVHAQRIAARDRDYGAGLLGVPPGERIAPASIVKPLVDGAIAALDTHDGSTLGDVSERIRRQLRDASRERIAALLADARAAALGRRRLLWPRARGVQ